MFPDLGSLYNNYPEVILGCASILIDICVSEYFRNMFVVGYVDDIKYIFKPIPLEYMPRFNIIDIDKWLRILFQYTPKLRICIPEIGDLITLPEGHIHWPEAYINLLWLKIHLPEENIPIPDPEKYIPKSTWSLLNQRIDMSYSISPLYQSSGKITYFRVPTTEVAFMMAPFHDLLTLIDITQTLNYGLNPRLRLCGLGFENVDGRYDVDINGVYKLTGRLYDVFSVAIPNPAELYGMGPYGLYLADGYEPDWDRINREN